MPQASSRKDTVAPASAEALAASYGSLFLRLLPGLKASLLVDSAMHFLGSVGPIGAQRQVIEWMSSLGWSRVSGVKRLRRLN